MNQTLLQQLAKAVECRWPVVVGCARQNILSPVRPWRHARGNALLALVGVKAVVSAPFGPFDVFYRMDERGQTQLLQFRGGDWRPWWDEDLTLFGALVAVYSNLNPVSIAVLHENRGDLTARYISVDREHAHTLVSETLTHYAVDPPTRIAKNGLRARATCPYCPAATSCKVIDIDTGQTDDWTTT